MPARVIASRVTAISSLRRGIHEDDVKPPLPAPRSGPLPTHLWPHLCAVAHTLAVRRRRRSAASAAWRSTNRAYAAPWSSAPSLARPFRRRDPAPVRQRSASRLLSNASRTGLCRRTPPAGASSVVPSPHQQPTHGGHARPFDEPSANKVSELGVVTLERSDRLPAAGRPHDGVLQDGSIVQEISDAQVRQAVLACAH